MLSLCKLSYDCTLFNLYHLCRAIHTDSVMYTVLLSAHTLHTTLWYLQCVDTVPGVHVCSLQSSVPCPLALDCGECVPEWEAVLLLLWVMSSCGSSPHTHTTVHVVLLHKAQHVCKHGSAVFVQAVKRLHNWPVCTTCVGLHIHVQIVLNIQVLHIHTY